MKNLTTNLFFIFFILVISSLVLAESPTGIDLVMSEGSGTTPTGINLIVGERVAINDTTAPVLSNLKCRDCDSLNRTTNTKPSFNVTCIDNLNSCEMVRIENATNSYDGMGGTRNGSLISGSIWNATIITADTLGQGWNTVCLTASDNVSNSHSTCNLTGNVFVDSISPIVDIISPINNTSYTITSIDFNWSASDTNLDTVFYSLDNGTNTTLTTNITFISTTGIHNVRLCANDTVGNEGCTEHYFSIIPSCTFNGFGNLTKYEYETNVTVLCNLNSTILVDTDVDSFNVEENVSIDYKIDTLRLKEFSDGTNTKSFTSNDSVIINSDYRNELISLVINVTGKLFSGNNPLNVLIQTVNQYIELKGTLRDDILENNLILCDISTQTTSCNLSFAQSGTQNFYFNISLVNKVNISDLNLNISFDLSGFDIDIGNDFDYTETFNNSKYVNYTLTNILSPHSVLDNFDNSTFSDSKWSVSNIGTGTFSSGVIEADDNYYSNIIYTSGAVYPSCGGDSSSQDVEDISFSNIVNKSFIEANVRFHRKCIAGSNLNSVTAYNSIRFSDGSNYVSMYYLTTSCSYSQTKDESFTGNITFRKTTENNWDVFNNNTFVDTVSTTTLNASKEWTLIFRSGKSFFYCSGDITTSLEVLANMSVFEVRTGSSMLNLTNGKYLSNGSFTSNTLFVAPNNIEAVTITANEVKPVGTSTTYEASNDAGSTWEKITLGFRHTFTAVGDNLRVRTNLTTLDNTKTPEIINYRAQILPGSGSNITIDIGADGTIDCNLTGILNSSTSPKSCTPSITSFEEYVGENCKNAQNCMVANTLTTESGAITQLHNVNISYNINPITLNETIFENRNSTPINVTTIQGNLTLNDLKLDFKGRHNLSLDVGSTNYVLQVFYSPFRVDIIPYNIEEWNIAPNIYSYVQNNIYPFGNPNGDGNPFYNVSKNTWDHPVDIYVSYNESVNTCQETWFEGQNDTDYSKMSVTLNTTQQLIFDNIETNGLRHNITSYTNISCSAWNSTLIFPYFCWNSMCEDCILSHGWDICDITN